MLILNGCGTTTDFGGIDRQPHLSPAAELACGAFRPITWSKSDTDPTIRQIKAHDAVYGVLCPDTGATRPAAGH
ncbi:MAG: hypothetical protein P4L82_05745 [Ancalomicrobiaceae bacterium]|nr:hypothetical protein [Ancalomicrobiaceae bacterium]